MRMTDTDFILREKNRCQLPDRIHFGIKDGAIILGFLAVFMSLVFLLAR